jgi:hypothetical protein
VSVSERPREVKIHKKLVIQESDSEEEEFGGAVKKQKTSYHSAATMPPSRPHPVLVPVPPRSPVKVSPYSSLVLEIDKDMDDKEALRVTLEAAWQFISDSDKDNIFATAVQSSSFMRHSLLDIELNRNNVVTFRLLCVSAFFRCLHSDDVNIIPTCQLHICSLSLPRTLFAHTVSHSHSFPSPSGH